MNKFEELKREAGMYVDTSGRWANADAVDRYAQLIVEECASLAYDGPGGILEHFGVEEPPVDNVDRILRTVRTRG